MSTGLKGGAEAAIHGMKNIFEMETTEAVILVDAENAFNELNRSVALHNIQYLCPNFATVLINTYRLPSRLFLVGGGEISSTEGTTQGDTLAIPFYGISLRPLINTLDYSKTNVHQVWLADDATGAGSLEHLKRWWKIVEEEGKKFGYVVKPSKSWLILKNPENLPRAQELFSETSIKITTDGQRHLGAAIGTPEYKHTYITEKVEEWCQRLKKLSAIAKTQPHAAYSGYIIGEQHKYTYFLRTLPNISDTLKPLDNIIEEEFIPALLGTSISTNEREILSLPIREGGLGLRIHHQVSSSTYNASKNVTRPLTKQIEQQNQQLPDPDDVKDAKARTNQHLKQIDEEKHNLLLCKQTPEMARNLEQLSEPGASSWVGAIPLKEQGLNLNRAEFNDAMCLRYDKPLKNLPSKCPCGKKFTTTHAMNCKRGGFISARHDNIRNFTARLLKEVCNDVQIEPPLQPTGGAQLPKGSLTEDGARPDIRARGFWRKGQQAFFDVRVTDADNHSQSTRTLKAILQTHENEKKKHYNSRVMEVEQGTFTPLVSTAKGVTAPEATRFYKTLASKIATKTGEQYNDVTRLIRVKLSFLALRSALLCLRGSRTLFSANSEACEDFAFSLNELNLR